MLARGCSATGRLQSRSGHALVLDCRAHGRLRRFDPELRRARLAAQPPPDDDLCRAWRGCPSGCRSRAKDGSCPTVIFSTSIALAGPRPDAPLCWCCTDWKARRARATCAALLRELRAHGVGAVAINFRGCSGEPNRLPRFYHSGDTGDLAYVVDRLRAAAAGPRARPGRLFARRQRRRQVSRRARRRRAAGECAPARWCRCRSIWRCAPRSLDGPDFMARVYRERFLRRLRAKVARQGARARLGRVDKARARAHLLRDCDDDVTAPLHGFTERRGLLARSSVGPLSCRR